MKIKKYLLVTLLYLSGNLFWLQAQIVTLDPIFATVDDDVTITYDASQGTGQLAGIQPVFMHAGVITQSGGPGSWQYVQGEWGTYDENGLMTYEGNNMHTKTINIRDFFGIPMGEVVTHLAFVFRNEDGSLEGKTADGQDIFVPIYDSNSNFLLAMTLPVDDGIITTVGSEIAVQAYTTQPADFRIEDNGNLIAQSGGAVTEFSHQLAITQGGAHTVVVTAEMGTEIEVDSFHYIINGTVVVENPPVGTINGINQIDANAIRLQLWAPYKSYVYVLGDFNDWIPHPDYFMKRSADGTTWWLDIENLDPAGEYAFQYYVDGDIRIADPYSEKVLDPFNDAEIDSNTFPNLKPYPFGKTTGIVTAFKTQDTPFNWQHDDYERPDKQDLVIYELLLRDFLHAHNFQTLMDTLSYLDELGVNAIELMPVSEFEGNNSWGYNPSFHMALDKYYGTPEAFKMLIDACHERGIAVILDVVYNHVFSQSPLAQLYWDQAEFKPTADNPWLNPDAKHPFNVGYDMNHESTATQAWLDQVMLYWIDEYHVDGFRFDLSKGFTQNTTTDVGIWSNYDASRISLLQRIADVIWAQDPDFYVILEHFAEAEEERELSDYGMMLWGNGVHEFNEATMGWESDLSVIDYKVPWRDFDDPHLVGYLESHDEERLMYKNLQWGNSSTDYDVQQFQTALKRQELAGAFFFTLPGPKMFWQFGELGYGYSINTCEDGTIDPDCRLSPKPIRWDYWATPGRRDIYYTWRALIHLKKNYPVFRTDYYEYNLDDKLKSITLIDPNDMKVVVLGNFDVLSGSIDPNFPETGWWYDYFSGDSLNITDPNQLISLEPGEYRIYITEQVEPPFVNVNEAIGIQRFDCFPNPTSGAFNVVIELTDAEEVSVVVFDVLGKPVRELYQGASRRIQFSAGLDDVGAGCYFVRLTTSKSSWTRKLINRS